MKYIQPKAELGLPLQGVAQNLCKLKFSQKEKSCINIPLGLHVLENDTFQRKIHIVT